MQSGATCRVENGVTWKQDYNTENRISAIHKMNPASGGAGSDCTTGTILESWLFGYDGDGVRVSTAHFTGGTAESLSVYYFGGSYEVTDGAVKKYYSFAGQTIAMKDANGLQYFLTDHLGSIVAVTDSSGTLTSQQRYLPFGGVRELPNYPTTELTTDFGYTGQRDYPTIGLMDYRARFYDPYLNRFIQPDSLIPNPSSPQAFNRYSYVGNRPINFNDPTGHKWDDCGERTGYACKIHMKQVGIIKAQGEKEKAASGSNSGINGCAVVTLACVTGGIFLSTFDLAPIPSNNNELGSGTEQDVISIILNDYYELLRQIDNNGGCNNFWNNSLCLDYIAMASQDIATLASITGASGTLFSITVGCAAGTGAGGAGLLPGCAGGYAVGVEFHVNITNVLETTASFTSLVTTFQSDIVTGDNRFPSWNPLTWKFGEDTKTSALTFALGTIPEPFIDSIIDIYASGYNHGFFCGVSTILDCLP